MRDHLLNWLLAESCSRSSLDGVHTWTRIEPDRLPGATNVHRRTRKVVDHPRLSENGRVIYDQIAFMKVVMEITNAYEHEE
ncbi:MAG: hypothetical protein C5B50_24620 [Verrucomicrobia bacterium]|nr:MAG: hypothetical protein C5B50_24620 [Verrucomicrobiota bacterium]